MKQNLYEYTQMFTTPVRHYLFEKVSFLTMQRHAAVSFSLHDIIAASKVEEPVAIYFTIEMLKILECLQSCTIVHGNITTENVLSAYGDEWGEWDREGRNGWDKKGLFIVDFSKSVDLSLFPSDLQILHPVTKQLASPYLMDTIAAAKMIHMLLLRSKMEIENRDGVLATKVPRWTNYKLWNPLFERLLNTGDVTGLRNMFETHLEQGKKEMLKTHLMKLHNNMLKLQT
jgi:checkpoint serine/threonine-protein kinase